MQTHPGKHQYSTRVFYAFHSHSRTIVRLLHNRHHIFSPDLHDFATMDFRVDLDGRPWLLEVGLFCSFYDGTHLTRMAQQVGTSSKQLFLKLAKNAIARHQNNNNNKNNNKNNKNNVRNGLLS